MARGRPSKKGLIADAALNLFKVSGYQATTIDQVVLEAGVSKPTVYSNYPSKLLLWQEVLRQIIAQSEECLQQVYEEQVAKQESFSSGWNTIWLTWVSAPERLAVYRINWGESHKLTLEERDCFDQFESVLNKQLKQWMAYHSIDSDKYLVLSAVSKEAVLMPAITQRDSCCKHFEQLVETLI